MKRIFFLISYFYLVGIAGAQCILLVPAVQTAGQNFGADVPAASKFAFYYDYENSTNAPHDPLNNAGCQGYGDAGFGIVNANGNIRLDLYNWGQNGGCPTTACPIVVNGTSRNVAVLTMHNTTVSPYTTSIAAHSSNSWNGTLFRYADGALASNTVGEPSKFFQLPAPAITGATCAGGTCSSISLTISNATAGSGLYGTPLAGPAIAGYKIWKFDAVAAPTNGNEGAAVGTWQDTGQYIAFTAGATSSGNVTSISATSGALRLGYEVVFNDRAATAIATLSTRGIRTPKISPASASISPNAVKFVSFSGTWKGTRITLRWVTASEIDSAGFNLYRMNGSNEWVKINAAIISSKSQGGSGASYEYIDKVTGPAKPARYMVREVPLNNTAGDSIETIVTKRK